MSVHPLTSDNIPASPKSCDLGLGRELHAAIFVWISYTRVKKSVVSGAKDTEILPVVIRVAAVDVIYLRALKKFSHKSLCH